MKKMADQFADWDRFMRHYTETRDPRKALRWTAYEKWAEERRFARLRWEADHLADQSAAKASGRHSETTTKLQ